MNINPKEKEGLLRILKKRGPVFRGNRSLSLGLENRRGGLLDRQGEGFFEFIDD
jgi:hypothetical protein